MTDKTVNISTLTIDEVYALKGVFYGLEGLMKKICRSYKVNHGELLEKLEAVTDAWEHNAYSARS